jgi:hypothetical protein
VPFPLGRPLGVADNPDFQRDVLRSALQLLETATEPTIADYPHEAPDGNGDGVWACAIELPTLEMSELESSLRTEVDLLMPRYQEARRARGRTTFGMSGATVDEIDKVVSFAIAIAEGSGFEQVPAIASGPNWRHRMPMLVRFVVEDLRALYQEAVTSEADSLPPSQRDIHTWIFQETALGRLLKQIAQQITDHDDPRLKLMRGFIIPEGFWEGDHSFGGIPAGVTPDEYVKSIQPYLIGEQA